MKKLQSLVLVLVVAFLASCSGGSLESMVKDYEKACEKGNVVEAEKIADQIDEKYPEGSAEWTEELQERVLVATGKLIENAVEDMKDALEDEAEDMYDYAMDEAEDIYGEAVKEAEKMMDEAIEEAEDMMDEAMSEVW